MSVAITGLIDEELVAVLPKNWKFLCHNGKGFCRVVLGLGGVGVLGCCADGE